MKKPYTERSVSEMMREHHEQQRKVYPHRKDYHSDGTPVVHDRNFYAARRSETPEEFFLFKQAQLCTPKGEPLSSVSRLQQFCAMVADFHKQYEHIIRKACDEIETIDTYTYEIAEDFRRLLFILKKVGEGRPLQNTESNVLTEGIEWFAEETMRILEEIQYQHPQTSSILNVKNAYKSNIHIQWLSIAGWYRQAFKAKI